VQQTVKKVTGCDRVYTAMIGETGSCVHHCLACLAVGKERRARGAGAGGGEGRREPASDRWLRMCRHLHAQIWPRYPDAKLESLGITETGKYGHPFGKAIGVFDLARAVGSGEVRSALLIRGQH